MVMSYRIFLNTILYVNNKDNYKSSSLNLIYYACKVIFIRGVDRLRVFHDLILILYKTIVPWHNFVNRLHY
jgi:hypothetical protein